MAKEIRQFPGITFSYLILLSRTTAEQSSNQELNKALLSADFSLVRNLLDENPTEIVESLTQLKNHLEEASIQHAEQEKRTNTLLKDLEVQAKERQGAWEAEKKSIIEGIRREALEFTKIETSINLWAEKARSHMTAFYLASALFVTALIGVPVYIIKYSVPFVANLAKQFSGNTEFLGLALLIIPAVAVGWLLRFVARIAIQNLGLAQDARQRHAQITTYLRLLGDERQPISKNERILALAALFRPMPGQGGDDVNPPTVADLLKEAGQQMLAKK